MELSEIKETNLDMEASLYLKTEIETLLREKEEFNLNWILAEQGVRRNVGEKYYIFHV